MLPRALLFSSDPQVAEVILGLLPEFGIEVEHCRDVFGAIERLTSRSYHAIVVDWKEGLEASFVLKTTRELSSAKTTPVIAVVGETEASGALSAGANAVLIRPLAFDLARRTFIAALPDVCTERATAAPDGPRQAPSPPTTASAQTQAPARILDRPAAAKRTSRVSVPKPPSFAGYAQEPRRSSKHRNTVFAIPLLGLLVAGLLIATGFRFRREFMNAFQVAKSVVRLPARPAESAAATSPATSARAELQLEPHFSQEAPPPRLNRTRTLEVYPAFSAAKPGVPQLAHGPSNPVNSTAEAELKLIRPEIPPSLMVPVTAMASHAPETRLSAPPANKWSVEPILLPENISRELLVRQIVPEYPQLAAAAGVEGSVLLHAFVGKDGSIQDLKLISGPLVLGRAAFDSVKQWRYRPYRFNGQAVEMQTFVTVNFLRSPSTAMAQK